jgi:hypothetical protein
VYFSEASPLAALDRIGSRGGDGEGDYVNHVLLNVSAVRIFKGMKISSTSLIDYIS